MGNEFNVNHEFGTHMKQSVASNTDKTTSKLFIEHGFGELCESI